MLGQTVTGQDAKDLDEVQVEQYYVWDTTGSKPIVAPNLS